MYQHFLSNSLILCVISLFISWCPFCHCAGTLECLSNASQIHAFYYLWYGNFQTDNQWLHWNHEVLPHWTDAVNRQYKEKIGSRFEPPLRLHSPFYPSLGPYSSRDPNTIRSHITQMSQSGIEVAVLSWWGMVRVPYQWVLYFMCCLTNILYQSNLIIIFCLALFLSVYVARSPGDVRHSRCIY